MKNRLFGTTLFLSGCCIGAGMLGMPLITYQAGFYPSLVLFILSFLFMTATGFLLAETSFRFDEKTSLLMMSEQLLGKPAKWITCALFLFLMYALIAAYTIGAADIIQNTAQALGFELSSGTAMFLVTVVFAAALYLGTSFMDIFNRILMVGLGVGYLAIITIGSSSIDTGFLAEHDWSASLYIAPIMIIAFGYHNLIPSMRSFLPSRRKLAEALLLGALIPLLIYLVWEFILLGLLPLNQKESINSMIKEGVMIGDVLKRLTQNGLIVLAVQIFTFCAITTSYIGQSVSIIDLLGKHFKKNRLYLVCMTLLPPYLIAAYYPDIFLKALSSAGAYGAV
ncbi:MAG: aromatic amino acid transport family protein, partial [Chlamydiota bacterium]